MQDREPIPVLTRPDDVRVCPACAAPMELVATGTDKRKGNYEDWRCTGFSIGEGKAHADAGVKDGRVTLYAKDYTAAEKRKAYLARFKPNPKHAAYCNKSVGMPGPCSCAESMKPFRRLVGKDFDGRPVDVEV